MTRKAARDILVCRRPSGGDDEDRLMREALKVAEATPDLSAEWKTQHAFDARLATDLEVLVLSEDAKAKVAAAKELLQARQNAHRISSSAMVAVGVGFLLLICVVVWNLLGRAGTFPEDAIKIATEGNKARPEQFEPVETKAGSLADWFMMKSFDNYRVPAAFANFETAGVRLFRVENEQIAQAAIPENFMYFYVFNPRPFGFSVVPEKTWRVSEADRWVLAIREEGGMCFMIALKGTKADMERILKQAGQ